MFSGTTAALQNEVMCARISCFFLHHFCFGSSKAEFSFRGWKENLYRFEEVTRVGGEPVKGCCQVRRWLTKSHTGVLF